MIEILYGCAVAFAGVVAYRSGLEVLQRVMGALFLGWIIYANNSAAALSPVSFNICLDLTLLAAISLTWLTWKGTPAASCCHWVAFTLLTMICLHIAQKLLSFSLYGYYLTYNVLFLTQLISVVSYSYITLRVKNKQNMGAKGGIKCQLTRNVQLSLRPISPQSKAM